MDADVTAAYHMLMFCEVADLLLCCFLYSIARFPKGHFKPLVMHHVLVVIGMSTYFYGVGNPDAFVTLNTISIFVPFWYINRLWPNYITSAIRGTVVAYGRVIALIVTVSMVIQHLFCMEDKINTSISLAILLLFIWKIEVPMFHVATKSFENMKNPY